MKKNNLLVERFQKLAGITPLHELDIDSLNGDNGIKVYTATFDDDFGTFIDDLATVIGADYALDSGASETGSPIEISPQDFNAWDEFGYGKHWNLIPDGQPFKITGNTPGLTDYPSLKNYTFTKKGDVISGIKSVKE
jgi:hypothetical protein